MSTIEEGFNSTVDKETLIKDLQECSQKLAGTKVKENNQAAKTELLKKIDETIQEATDSTNYKINRINSGVDKKSKKLLVVITNILSKKLAKFLVDEIIEEIVKELNGK